jgi:hypothetical protein
MRGFKGGVRADQRDLARVLRQHRKLLATMLTPDHAE